jgi:hypothetical protein
VNSKTACGREHRVVIVGAEFGGINAAGLQGAIARENHVWALSYVTYERGACLITTTVPPGWSGLHPVDEEHEAAHEISTMPHK